MQSQGRSERCGAGESASRGQNQESATSDPERIANSFTRGRRASGLPPQVKPAPFLWLRVLVGFVFLSNF